MFFYSKKYGHNIFEMNHLIDPAKTIDTHGLMLRKFRSLRRTRIGLQMRLDQRIV